MLIYGIFCSYQVVRADEEGLSDVYNSITYQGVRANEEEEVLLDVYNLAEVFRLNYEEMERKFKVYIYKDGDSKTFYRTPRKLTGKYSSEGYFFQNIRVSKFVTEDPDEAHSFFIPISCHKMRGKGTSYENMTIIVQNYVDSLIAKYPYWNRTMGADHFFVTCHDVGVRATEGHPFFHLPFQLEEMTLRSGQLWVSEQVIETLKSGDTGPLVYQKRFYRTKFCICPGGSQVNSARITDSIHYGCVPVILSDYYDLPFNDILDWHKFAVILREKDVYDLKQILKNITQEEFVTLHNNLVKIQKHFQWNTPPVRHDAFHMVMYDLWLRHHVIK
ncbi:hypothetical protein K7X08_003129 [Anisodus acutangulus]|uniref:Exostosin GT47 domain-containing protein n=1 Tax=Anisodus acutangulus TaxID=402998 RepID=A0A9Q1RHY9_9SOLA|nr:hypothetical protein K7X08_003129 [Anisodus acutangulus]